jgi:hypothetical protein
MKKNFMGLLPAVFLVAVTSTSFAQISNTQTTISLANPSASGCPSPAAGNYTLSISYLDLNTGNVTPATNYNATVSYSGTTIIITAPTASFPTGATAGYDLSQTTGNLSIGTSGTYFFDNGQYNCSALPLTLIAWNATATEVSGKKQINFTWTTASESNTCYFSIEWTSVSNQVWQGSICKVPAAGQSSQNINYSFVWLYPQAVDYLFRLKMVDMDGHFTYSPILHKPMSCSSGGSACYRSPGACSVTINGPGLVCSSNTGDYTLSSLNTSSVNWWLSSTSLASVSDIPCTSNGTHLNANAYTFGTVTLNAQIGGCSNTISKNIQIGASADFTYTVFSDGYLIASGPSLPGYTNYQWTLSLGSKGTYHFSGPGVSFQMPQCSGGSLNLSVSTPCGQFSAGHTIWNSNCGGFYMVSSTQTSGSVKIQPANANTKDKTQHTLPSIKQILIYDSFMNIKLDKKYSGLTNFIDLDVSNLQTGIYFIQLVTEGGKETHQIQVLK